MKTIESLARQIRQGEWIKYWAGKWSLFSCSYFGQIYLKHLPEILGKGFTKTIIIIRNGYSTAYLEKKDRAKLGQFLAKKAENDPHYVSAISSNLVRASEKITGFIRENRIKPPTQNQLDGFVARVYEYYPWHVAVKNLVDYLPPECLKKHLVELEKARVHAEPTFTETERFTEKFAENLAERSNLDKNLLLCMTRKELEAFLKKGESLSSKTLEKRNKASALVFGRKGCEWVIGKKVEIIEKALHDVMGHGIVQGVCAHPGKVEGRVRIVLNPATCKAFNERDILIAEMTRPEYLPLIRKAGAVVTDAGGILCHAAIVARELKKPTVIGTQNATKALKEGDWVQVDAAIGTVRRIEKTGTGIFTRRKNSHLKKSSKP